MSRPSRRVLTHDQEVQHNTRLFLDGRLASLSAIEWAARLQPHQTAERAAVRDVLESRANPPKEPFRTAWRCILETWNDARPDVQLKAIDIREDLRSGLEPRWVLDEVVALVTPRLIVDVRSPFWDDQRKRRLARPGDILSLRLTASDLVGLRDVGLDRLEDASVLAELADRLEGALLHALHRSRRVSTEWISNWIARVYPPSATAAPDDDEEEEDDGDDPDRFRHGFVPIARLFSETLLALADLDPAAAARRVRRLEDLDWPLTRRIWVAAARHPALVPADGITEWLLALTDDEFWDTDRHPEAAELRARRFGELPDGARQTIEARLRRRRPAAHYRKGLDRSIRERLRDQSAADELWRIQGAGHELSAKSIEWLSAHSEADAAARADIEHGLYETGRYVPGEVGSTYSDEDGPALLRRLEQDLAGRLYVEGRSAMDYVTVNTDRVFELVQAEPHPEEFPRTWAALASATRDAGSGAENNQARAEALLAALAAQPAGALDAAIDGISYWMDGAGRLSGSDDRFRALWLKLWPAAVAETNRNHQSQSESTPPLPFEADEDSDKLASESLNSSAGRMMSAFFSMLPPSLQDTPQPFDDPLLADLREATLQAGGAARLQTLYRLLAHLGYLRRADPAWTDAHLIEPLVGATGPDLQLWESISRIGILALETLAIIGSHMVRVVSGTALPREVRARLAERLVLPTLLALANSKDPPVPLVDMQQMLRTGGDAVRTRSASALVHFMVARKGEAASYDVAVRPFLDQAWPRDRTAISENVADALAKLPAATGDRFERAVEDIEPFLAPFDAWSLFEYGLYGRDAEGRVLLVPQTATQARALLRLLDLTIGREEGAVAPRDLDVGLQRMQQLDRTIVRDPRFMRLLSLARR